MRNKKGQFIKGHGFWAGKKRPGFKTETTFKEGQTPWNKDKHVGNFGNGFKDGDNMGEEHFAWKGDKVGYGALHDWVRRRLGKATKCIHGHKSKLYVWANISGEYKRELSDWHQLCQHCNMTDNIKIHKRFLNA